MKCPLCGAWSEVLETRPSQFNTQRRGRECANGHRFTTYEVYTQTYNAARRDTEKTAKTMDLRAQRFRRDAEIVRSSFPAAYEAERHGLTDARIRQIRSAARDNYAKRKNVAGVRHQR